MLDLELCCPSGKVETHEDLNWHGDLCRHWDGGYSCPTGCNVKDPGPYCVQEGTADSPCRINAGEDCTPSICPASHPYLDYAAAEKEKYVIDVLNAHWPFSLQVLGGA